MNQARNLVHQVLGLPKRAGGGCFALTRATQSSTGSVPWISLASAEVTGASTPARSVACARSGTRPRERVLLRTEELHPEVARQLDPWEIALVVVSVGELARLLSGAAQESGAKPGALEQHGDRRAERPGPDDRGTTRMLAGIR